MQETLMASYMLTQQDSLTTSPCLGPRKAPLRSANEQHALPCPVSVQLPGGPPCESPSTNTKHGPRRIALAACRSCLLCVTGLHQPSKKARGEGVHLVGVSVPGKLKQPFTASYITKQKRLCLNYTLFVLKGGVPLRRPLALKGIYGKHVSGLGS